jgi:uncharacterized protein
MESRAAYLISSLGLTPHPEGGHFCEVYRSSSTVQPLDQRPKRPALTSIYFLLTADEVSRWHQVTSDEIWHYYEGAPLELFTMDPQFQHIEQKMLGSISEGVQTVRVVPAREWQAARSTGAYTLVGCTVGPGFDFADFQMLRDLPAEAAAVQQRFPELALFL